MSPSVILLMWPLRTAEREAREGRGEFVSRSLQGQVFRRSRGLPLTVLVPNG